MNDHTTTQQLIENIEKKDRRFRTAQAIFMAILFSALVGIIFIQFKTLQSVQQQLVAQKDTAQETTKENQQIQDKIIRRLDCMVAFFSQTDRTNLSIADIDKCSLNRDGNVQQFFQSPESTPSAQSPTINQNPTPKTSTSAPTTTPPSNAVPNPVPAPVTVQPTPPPVTVLGIPLCVPFTGVCVR